MKARLSWGFAGLLLILAGCGDREKDAESLEKADSPKRELAGGPGGVPSPQGGGEAEPDQPAKSGHKPPNLPKIPEKRDYETAKAIPGKPGFVFNPWTSEEVDVRGIPPGTLVRDPKDADADHKFRVPKFEEKKDDGENQEKSKD